MTYAQLIRRLRDSLNLDQHELAERLGVRQSTVSRWENGTQPVGLPKKALDELLAQHNLRAA